jgi:N6-L-threonylcarbamoyladenine synthase
VAGVTTQDNIGEGQPTPTLVGGRNLRVFVISQRNVPLMPTYPRAARLLLKQGKARLVSATPFTIQLLYPTGETVQPISLGIDPGTRHIAVSATTAKNVLFEAEIVIRTDIQDLLATRKALRSTRRGRKTRYRPARFLNRTKPKGWLAPSVQNKVDQHVKIIKLVHRLLPIANQTLELAQFDIQKIKNPDIEGVEYQQGPLLNFLNVKAYCLARDNHTCQACKGKSGDKKLNAHHCETRKTGGDSPDNLITLCSTCHGSIHKEKLTALFKRRSKSFRDASQMNIMRSFIYEAIKAIDPNTTITYGYITKHVRDINNLDKSHMVDARCISGNALATSTTQYTMKQVRGQNRQLHKATIVKGGKRQANKAAKFVFGFQLFDKVIYKGQECFVFGRRNSGYFDIRLLDGTVVCRSANYKKLGLVEKTSTLLIQRNAASYHSQSKRPTWPTSRTTSARMTTYSNRALGVR